MHCWWSRPRTNRRAPEKTRCQTPGASGGPLSITAADGQRNLRIGGHLASHALRVRERSAESIRVGMVWNPDQFVEVFLAVARLAHVEVNRRSIRIEVQRKSH